MEAYDLYGLKVHSEIPLKGWSPQKLFDNPKAIIKFGKVEIPKDNIPDTVYRPFSVFNKNLYYLEVPMIARYEINDQSNVTIELLSTGKNKRNIALIIFWDSILSILLIKNNIFPIRASGIVTNNGKASLFTGPRGVGKSTLAAALCVNGYKLLCDDLCVIKMDNDNNQLYVKGYVSYIDLWRDALVILKEKKYNASIIRNEILKYRVDFSSSFCLDYIPIEAIYSLKIINDDVDFSVKKLSGLNKIQLSKKLVHSDAIAKVLGDSKMLFHFSTTIANKLDIYHLEKSRLNSVEETIKYLENEIFRKAT